MGLWFAIAAISNFPFWLTCRFGFPNSILTAIHCKALTHTDTVQEVYISLHVTAFTTIPILTLSYFLYTTSGFSWDRCFFIFICKKQVSFLLSSFIINKGKIEKKINIVENKIQFLIRRTIVTHLFLVKKNRGQYQLGESCIQVFVCSISYLQEFGQW